MEVGWREVEVGRQVLVEMDEFLREGGEGGQRVPRRERSGAVLVPDVSDVSSRNGPWTATHLETSNRMPTIITYEANRPVSPVSVRPIAAWPSGGIIPARDGSPATNLSSTIGSRTPTMSDFIVTNSATPVLIIRSKQ
jgi:hypothetical protein